MAEKKQTNLRTSDLTRQQLEDLKRWWGTSTTETITLIVARAWERANKEREDGRNQSAQAS